MQAHLLLHGRAELAAQVQREAHSLPVDDVSRLHSCQLPLLMPQGQVVNRGGLVEELQVVLQIPPHRVVLQILPCDLLLERMEHCLLLHQLILVISTLQLIYLLGLHKLKFLLLNDDVSEAVIHLVTVESHLVLFLIVIVDRGPRTVVPLEPQIHAIFEVLAALVK